MTRREAFRVFVHTPTPWILWGYLAFLAQARIRLGGWGWADAAVVVAVVAFQPFTEWLLHTYVLHFKPRTVGGRTIDLPLAREHRRHHLDPKDPQAVFTPLFTLLVDVPIAGALSWLVLGWHLGLTLSCAGLTIFLVYEWTHYLMHTAYQPKGRHYRSVWRAHRLHHHRNEHYWMGITSNVADRVLRTFPDKAAVPLSPTARTLGVDEPV